jgi:hypothetical protein
MTKHNFIILIQDDDNAEFFENKLNENNVGFELEIIGNHPDLAYEFKINIENQKMVKYIINMYCIQVLDFISN